MRIFVADDQVVVREGIKRIIADTSDMVVVGEAKASQDIVAQVNAQPVDVVILDVSLPSGNGLEVLQELKQAQPWVPVLVFSSHPEYHYAVRAFKAGAKGYLTKDSQPEELLQALRKVAQGGCYASPALAEHLILSMAQEAEQPLHARLSNREYQVLCLLASGKTVSAIGEELALSVKTISTYRGRLLEKLQLRTTAELIHYAIQQRLVE
jgi:two-component system, NarL family, invasion response regulator UvrY